MSDSSNEKHEVMQHVPFESLTGKTLTNVIVSDDRTEINIHTAVGDCYRLWHEQDCCEEVRIEEIIGDLDDLIGHPLLLAEEVVFEGETGPIQRDEDSGTGTWTFYKLSTIKGSVTFRWLGTSNGYYSETVSFAKVT